MCAQIGLNDLHGGLLSLRSSFASVFTSQLDLMRGLHIMLFVLCMLVFAFFIMFMVGEDGKREEGGGPPRWLQKHARH